ncbi:MAG: hypothetical protein PHE48_01665 [Candidatus Daviesbacteria bacterium]|nr:hypothetical protein [Candidatus Daviesbacteria bacterium]
MRNKPLVLTFLFLFFGVKPVFAAVSIDAPTINQSEIPINQSFSANSNLNNVQTGEIYFVKCRIGASSSSLLEGQTYNPLTTSWLYDTDSWTDMPTITAIDSTISFSIQCKIKSNATEGQKIIYARACLKKPDGICGSGTSFQSSSGITITAIAQPSSSPSSTSSSTPSPTPTPIPSSTPQATSSFTISNIPSQINSDQSFNVSVNLTLPNNKNADYYLTGAFKRVDGTRYFGLTKIGSSWIKYESSNYLNQYKITTDDSGNWTGTLEVEPDASDTDYKGSGDYIFKVGRYTSSGSSPTWSNESTITITSTENGDQDSTSTSTSNSLPSTTNSPTPSVKATTTTSSQVRSSDKLIYQIASVAGATISAKSATEEGAVNVKNQKQINPIVWLGLALIFAGCGSIGYIYFKKNAKIHIPWRR